MARLRGLAYNGDEYEFTNADRDGIIFRDNKVYPHSLLRVNYTTYDLRREQDTINPLTRADIIVLSEEDERTYPYWYARVIQIFHVMVEYRKDQSSPFSRPKRMDVLFVRWFQRDSNFSAGWDAKRLFQLQFFEQEHLADAFGFVDPESVIRGVHLVPAFTYDQTNQYLGPSFVHLNRDDSGWNEDWRFYYVNMYEVYLFQLRCNSTGGQGLSTETCLCGFEAVEWATSRPGTGTKFFSRKGVRYDRTQTWT